MSQHKRRPAPAWLQVLRELDPQCVLLIVLLGIAVAVMDKRLRPVIRPVYLQDATISLPHIDDDMPFWVALLVPFLVLVTTAAAIELLVVRDQPGRRAASNLANLLLSLFAAVAVVAFLTELFKRICGRLRPDFLARCQPAEPGGVQELPPYGSYARVTCRDKDGALLADGHMSFPSGHSSCSQAFGLFAALHLLWCLHLRDGGALAARLADPAGGWAGRAARELASLGAMLLVLFDLAWPWGVAVSRFIDNRHNISDIVGGLLLGATFTPLFVARYASACGRRAAADRGARCAPPQHEGSLQSHQISPALPVVCSPPSDGSA